MHEIDLNLLAHLAVLLQTRSVTQAAQRFGISQPAMSRSLARLRRLLGDPLLVRTRNGMLPTKRAEEMAEPLQHWLAEASLIVLPPGLEPRRLIRRFRIAASDHGVHSLVAPALGAIREAAPAVAIDLIPDSGDARATLAAGEADLVLTSLRPDRHLVHDRLLLSEAFVCVARVGHPLLRRAAAGRLGLDDLMQWPHVGLSAGEQRADPVSRLLAARGLERRIVATLPYFGAAAPLLAGTDALALLPAGAARQCAFDPRLEAVPAPAELGRFEQWALWHNRTHRDPAIHWLVDQLARHCEARPAVADGIAEPALEAAE